MGRILSTPSSAATSLADKYRADRRLYFTPGTFTFVVPSDVYNILGIVFGAGGSGGISSGSAVGSGGAGGGYAQGEIIVTPGQSITVTVGAEGAARTTSASTAGLAGGTSSIGTFLTATGGTGGSVTATQASGGTGSTSGVTNPVTFSGGNSVAPVAGNNAASGGASSGSPFGNGKTNGIISAGSQGAVGGGAGWGVDQPTLSQNVAMGGGSIARASIMSSTAATAALGANGWFLAGGTSATGDANGRTKGLLTGDERWWFPWEVDGSGGYAVGSAGTSGRGGFGSGGGGIYHASSDVRGGEGGFGGGGGGASTGTTATVLGGQGGIGGGGGGGARSASANSGVHFSGAGGSGAVLIYW